MATAPSKLCPHCGQEILILAKKCTYCGRYLDDTLKRDAPSDSVERMLLPVGRPMSSIAAGYLALIAVFPVLGAFFGLLAVLCGWLALKAIKKNPTLSGSGRAWFGIVFGGLMVVVQFVLAVAVLIAAAAQRMPRR